MFEIRVFSRNSKKVAGNLTVPDHKKLFSKESLDMRWFMLPTEAKELIFPSMFKTKKSKKNQLLTRGKFSPKTFEVSSADSAVEINPIGTLGGGSVVYPQPLQSAERRKMSNGAAGDGKKAGSSMNWLRGPFNAEEKRAENASKKKEGDAEDNANVLEEPEVQEEDNGASTVEEEPEDVQQQNGTPDENGVGSSEEEPADTEEKKKEEIKPAPPVAKPKKSLFGWFKKAPPPVETAANGNGQESEEESQVNGKAEENGSEENGVGGGGGGGADDEEPRAEVVATENVKVSEMDPGLR